MGAGMGRSNVIAEPSTDVIAGASAAGCEPLGGRTRRRGEGHDRDCRLAMRAVANAALLVDGVLMSPRRFRNCRPISGPVGGPPNGPRFRPISSTVRSILKVAQQICTHARSTRTGTPVARAIPASFSRFSAALEIRRSTFPPAPLATCQPPVPLWPSREAPRRRRRRCPW